MGTTTLYIAGRGGGTDPIGGLFRYRRDDTGWSGEKLAAVEQLSALAGHPRLPVVYGTSGTGDAGRMHAWRVDGPSAVPLIDTSSGGSEPCHLAVHPSGHWLLVVNYTSGTLACWHLDDAGVPSGEPTVTALVGSGSGVEPARQGEPHPHQAVVGPGGLLVPDLGADLVRRFGIDDEGIGPELPPYELPPGTGPRHLAQRADGTLVVSGELTQTIALISEGGCVTAPSTRRTGAAKSRSDRNYPGDLQLSPDGTVAYLANRGHDTIAVFRVNGRPGEPELIAEIDTGVRWPQHLLVIDNALLVAGWDSSVVVSMPLDDNGNPGNPVPLFDCPGAAWLLPG